MTCRIVIGNASIRVSKPGYDARSAGEDDLVFSSSRRHLMMVGSGGFNLSGGVRIDFGVALASVPLVICGTLYDEAIMKPVTVVVDLYGFNAWPLAKPNGSTPADGQWCTWVAFMRDQG